MTKEQIALVKKTWKVVMCIDAQIVGDAFYSKLFSDHPDIRRLFPEDMQKQYVKLVDMVTYIVSRLDRLDEAVEEIGAMASRHVGYGVKAVHYDMVGAALLWTLEVALQGDWTPSVKQAWSDCYRLLADAMLANS